MLLPCVAVHDSIRGDPDVANVLNVRFETVLVIARCPASAGVCLVCWRARTGAAGRAAARSEITIRQEIRTTSPTRSKPIFVPQLVQFGDHFARVFVDRRSNGYLVPVFHDPRSR